ncbi:hypothetical protein C9374_005558 [Naegleria lovaniensis]|uniref:Endonuclease n=1 Tax=Naegleria lovaniensis TaxID=51637 RepID=A0AA88KNA3_NAELO|nr:uncharacterized protein C9374_005558 [Naegleria lovaniensis]KAG2382356.1 hypothetical protein C9374_005558 [Naegleria lovaniensis]
MNVPLWTIHSIHSNSLSDQYSRRPNVYEWSSPPSLMHIPGTPFQSVGQIPYDRGHLVPCGDFTAFSEKYETFNIINRAPQLSQNNQGVWNQLEQALRNAIDQVAAQNNVHVEAIVVTRPLYDKKYNFQITTTKGINSIRTQIPFSFNKAVLIYYDGTLREAFCLSVLNRIVEHSSNFMNFIKDFSQCDNRVKEGIVINSFSVGQVFNFIKNEMQKRSYQHPTPRRDDSYKTNSVRTWNGFWNTYSSKAYGWWKNTKRYFRKNRPFFFPRRRRRQAKWKRPYQRRNRYEYHNQHRRRRRRY